MRRLTRKFAVPTAAARVLVRTFSIIQDILFKGCLPLLIAL